MSKSNLIDRTVAYTFILCMGFSILLSLLSAWIISAIVSGICLSLSTIMWVFKNKQDINTPSNEKFEEKIDEYKDKD
jgi:hypothetical protein